jgi:hypothetical protein
LHHFARLSESFQAPDITRLHAAPGVFLLSAAEATLALLLRIKTRLIPCSFALLFLLSFPSSLLRNEARKECKQKALTSEGAVEPAITPQTLKKFLFLLLLMRHVCALISSTQFL